MDTTPQEKARTRHRRLTVAAAGIVLTAGASIAGGTQATASPTGAERTPCRDELAYLVRLQRNATPGSAADFRLVEEIDKIVWPP